MSEQVTINRQEIVTVDGLHYKQEYRLVSVDRDYDYDCDWDFPRNNRFMATSPKITYRWYPMMTSGPYGVWPECGDCGGKNIFYKTYSMATAIKAGFLKLVAPVKR